MDDVERDMLRLDDELAGLMEAADTPAGQDASHPTKPEPASSLPGECIMPAAVLSFIGSTVMCCAEGLQCIVQW